MNFAYLFALLFSIAAMLTVDRRFTLAFFSNARRTAITLAISVSVFIVWDLLGVALDIFYSPGSPYMSGWYITPHFPVEELFFLFFLCYFTLILYLIGVRLWRHTSS